MAMSSTTYGDVPSLAPVESGATSRSRRVGGPKIAAPATEEECERLLDTAESADPRDLVAQLSPLLGASARCWSPRRRDRLQRAIAAAGMGAVEPVLATVASTPRPEVVDEAVASLTLAAGLDGRVLATLAQRLVESSRGATLGIAQVVTSAPPVRAALVRVLATGRDIQSLDDRRAALSYALADIAPEVRDAAVQALAGSPDRDRAVARSLLVERRALEDVPFLKDAIEEALEDLGGP